MENKDLQSLYYLLSQSEKIEELCNQEISRDGRVIISCFA